MLRTDFEEAADGLNETILRFEELLQKRGYEIPATIHVLRKVRRTKGHQHIAVNVDLIWEPEDPGGTWYLWYVMGDRGRQPVTTAPIDVRAHIARALPLMLQRLEQDRATPVESAQAARDFLHNFLNDLEIHAADHVSVAHAWAEKAKQLLPK